VEGQTYASDRGRELEPYSLKGTKLGSPSWESGQNLARGELRVELSRCSRLLRLRTVLHSHSSGLLIHRLGYSHVCSGLELEMEFVEVKIRVWV
jgi:hypothetical protein